MSGISASPARRVVGSLGLALGSLGIAGQAIAKPDVDLSASYAFDVAATLSGGEDGKVRYLDNAEATLDADLDGLLGIPDTSIHLGVIGNFGARANDGAGSLEGVSNIEVGRSAVHLFEAWAEHAFGGTSLRAGLYDLNSEFYANDASGLLLAPPFGIGSEIAASGGNGPSIFPSTALALRVRTALPAPKGYLQVAVLNAMAQTLGDPGGVDFSFDDGLLVAGEAGLGDRFRAALGAWTYTRASDALASVGADGEPLRARTWGVYGLTEFHFATLGKRDMAGFVRGGLAKGGSNPFANSFQAGLLVTPAILGRERSAFSLGYHRTTTSREYRKAQANAGETAWRCEQAIELTYSDALTSFATIQPDLQIIKKHDEAGLSATAVQAMLRLSFSF